MRVVLAINALPPITGGAEVSTRNLLFGLLDAGVVVHVLCGNTPSLAISSRVEAAGGSVTVPDRTLPAGAIAWEYDAFSRGDVLARLVAEHDIQLVHVFSHSAALSAAMALPSDVPVAATFHEMSTEDTATGQARAAFIHALSGIRLHLPMSNHYRSVIERHGVPAERIHQCRQGIDVDSFGIGTRERGQHVLGTPDDARVVLCPSRFTWWKGQATLIQAVSQLQRENKEVHLALLGSLHSGQAPYLDELQILASRLLAPASWRVITDVPYEEMPHVLAASAVVAQPSVREGLGFAALEALAAGRPLVVSDAAGFDEYCVAGVNCQRVPADDPAPLAQALQLALDGDCPRPDAGVATARRYDYRLGVADVRAAYATLVSAATGRKLGPAASES